jgi:hypothetical protein
MFKSSMYTVITNGIISYYIDKIEVSSRNSGAELAGKISCWCRENNYDIHKFILPIQIGIYVSQKKKDMKYIDRSIFSHTFLIPKDCKSGKYYIYICNF